MFSEEYLMFYGEFSVAKVLVDVEYNSIESHSQLHVNMLIYMSPD